MVQSHMTQATVEQAIHAWVSGARRSDTWREHLATFRDDGDPTAGPNAILPPAVSQARGEVFVLRAGEIFDAGASDVTDSDVASMDSTAALATLYARGSPADRKSVEAALVARFGLGAASRVALAWAQYIADSHGRPWIERFRTTFPDLARDDVPETTPDDPKPPLLERVEQASRVGAVGALGLSFHESHAARQLEAAQRDLEAAQRRTETFSAADDDHATTAQKLARAKADLAQAKRRGETFGARADEGPATELARARRDVEIFEARAKAAGVRQERHPTALEVYQTFGIGSRA